jgi:hypothetical protein
MNRKLRLVTIAVLTKCVLPLFCAGRLAAAQTLEFDKAVLTSAGSLKATMKWNVPLRGKGKLRLKWTDSYGRTAAEESLSVEVRGESLDFQLPLRRAVAMQNFLEAELLVGGRTVRAPLTEFIVTPPRTGVAVSKA